MPESRIVHLLGYASGLGGRAPGSKDGPVVLQNSKYLKDTGLSLEWQAMLSPEKSGTLSKLALISQLCQKLAKKTSSLTSSQKFFLTLGGDHSCAVGTWSGVFDAIKEKGPLGLIWIDAHMDSHTPHTSLTGNIHGMPLASLLGYGMPSLTQILVEQPKIKPQHLCLIGVRSFERGEAALLKQLNVRVFFMEEVRERGMQEVMKEALQIVTNGTAGFGVSLDVDAIDPVEAPGTGCPEPYGIAAKDLCSSLQLISEQPNFLGAEIVEFDPQFDSHNKTEKLISGLISSLILGKKYSTKQCCEKLIAENCEQ